MAVNKNLIDKPENLNQLLKQEQRDYDCTPCRIIGMFYLSCGSAFLGLAGYSYFSGMSQLQKQRAVILKSNPWLGMRSRKMGITGLSIGLAWMGLYRLFG
ncbi:hypothetical protein VSDG_08108 [Cytospora chrysosperma]|uniref:DUF4536 domain-containing protein n=1 Tax=Cytospora chrysosperma TaxID=252740 RepID=A0A423VF74_CYTCH|nr:hypothetical protein VSDG_08108 [Valsa sordida]